MDKLCTPAVEQSILGQAPRYIETILKYLGSATELNDHELKTVLKKALPELGDDTMATLKETWVSQGKQEGRQEGESTMLFRLLKKKFGQITAEVKQKIEKADSDTLLKWSENVLTASNIDAVFH